jgi:hypothetical protein
VGSSGALVGVAFTDAVGATVGVRTIESPPGPGSRVGTTVGDDVVGDEDAVGMVVGTVFSGVAVSSESDPAHETSAMTGIVMSNHIRPFMDEIPDTEILMGWVPLSERLDWTTTNQTHFLQTALPA